MNDQRDLDSFDDGDPDVMLERPEPTGIEPVDEVLDAVAGVGSVPLQEHPRVYEQAHAGLRAALDGPGSA